MMDPPSARLALKLQLDDVEAILKSIPASSTDAKVVGEIAAFRSHVDFATSLSRSGKKEENTNHVAFKRLLSEEQQAERDHDLACRLAGKPVPQRAPLFKTGNEAELAGSATKGTLNGAAEGLNKSGVDVAGIQTTSALSKQPFTESKPLYSLTSGKRTAEGQLTRSSDQTAVPSQVATEKRARVVDETEEDKVAEVAALESAETKKRVAFLDSAVLREDDDGRTKRTKLDEPKEDQPSGLNNATKGTSITAAVSTASKGMSGLSTPVTAIFSSCLDEHNKRNMLELSCSDEPNTERHAYCRECLVRLFESSVTDPSHFPPRCCSKTIPFFRCIQFLPAPLFARFIARREEFGTPNRTYCSNNQCSKWVRPANIEADVATCAECSQKTCTTCKAKQHEGLCQEDKDVKELMSVARQKRWQTCPSCKEMVELERGCYHITCRCRHEFCYLCVAKWKTCKCPAWDERNIINVGGVVGQAAPAPAPAPVPAAIPAPALPLNAAPAPFANQFPVLAPLQQANAGVGGIWNAPYRLFGLGQAPVNPGFFMNANPAAANPMQAQQAQQVHQPTISASKNRHGSRRGRRRGKHQPQHEHDFERFYRSMGWDTECNMCGHEDRWVNCCGECDLKVCWYCTKHRV